ncbi:MAG: hypothetical protein ACTHZW_04160 [Microbacteriaceae bacterium]
MAGSATSDQTSDDESTGTETGPTPPLADLTDRPAPTPGPLTKPGPVVRSPRNRARWLIPLIVIVVLAATAGGMILWQVSQTGLA